MLLKAAGGKAAYISGAGVANASYGLPDLGITSLDNVLEDVRRISDACDLPLLVDADTGWGQVLTIERTVKQMEKAGAAAIHLEDQVTAKRCGHRPDKAVVTPQEMADRIKSAVDARIDPDFVIMARTDAFAAEGLTQTLERARLYIESGADMIFAEALTTLDEYKSFTGQISVPVLANITEFGKTPLFTREELKQAGVQLILYPLSAFRAMSAAALHVYKTILNDGTQKNILNTMQTRDELYQILDYYEYEKKANQFRGKNGG